MITLVVTSFPLSLFRYRDRHNHVDAVEESRFTAFPCHYVSHVFSHIPSSLIFHFQHYARRWRVGQIIEQCRSLLYRHQSPETLCHLIVVWRGAECGARQMQVARHADGVFGYAEPLMTHGAEPWHHEVENASWKTYSHLHVVIVFFFCYADCYNISSAMAAQASASARA